MKREPVNMELLRGFRAMNDCYAPRRDDDTLPQKRLKLFAFLRCVEGVPLGKALRMVNEAHPYPSVERSKLP